MNIPKIKFIRTLQNQIIIGEVITGDETISILKPYNILPSPEGLELQPLDLEIVGREIEKIRIYKSALLYFTEPGDSLRDAYIQATSALKVDKPQLIIN